MCKRNRKVYLSLDNGEFALLRDCLIHWRNKLLAQSRDTGPIDELLVKLLAR